MAEVEQRTLNFLQWYEKNETKYAEFAKCVLKKVLDALKERAMCLLFDPFYHLYFYNQSTQDYGTVVV